MLTSEHRLGPSAPTPGATSAGQLLEDSPGGARLRLALGTAGLAVLVAWGAASGERGSLTNPQGTSVPAVSATGAHFDGHGKWTGY